MPIVQKNRMIHTNDIERLDLPLSDCPNCGADSVWVIRNICNTCNERNIMRQGKLLYKIVEDKNHKIVSKKYVKECDGSCQEHYVGSKSYSMTLRCVKCGHKWTVTKRLL
jgi:hypothetical protein